MPILVFRLIVGGILFALLAYFTVETLAHRQTGVAFGDDFEATMATFWGRVILVDLYSVLILAALWVFWRSGWALTGGLWGLSILIGGNPAFLVYLLWTTRNLSDPVDWPARLLGRELP